MNDGINTCFLSKKPEGRPINSPRCNRGLKATINNPEGVSQNITGNI